MQTPPSVAFHGFEPDEGVRALVDHHIARLEDRCESMTTVNVVVDQPHHHKKTGSPYDVRIEIGLPGTEIAINRHPGSNARKEDVGTAIRDAFHAAERKLEKWVHKQRGRVKHHEPEAHATVKSLDPYQGFGFIATPDGRDVWFSKAAVVGDAFDDLVVGSKVRFVESDQGVEGPMASTVEMLSR